MPRKKSNAKKAREAARKLEQGVVPAEEGSDDKATLPAHVEGQDEEGSEEEESSSEEEDDYGDLITEEVEDGIKNVLRAIRENDKEKLLDPKVRFFEDPEKAVEKMTRSERHKPVYLKDYHRMNILSGNTFGDDEEEEKTVDGRESYVSQQQAERSQLLDEIKNAFGDEGNEAEDEGEEDFLKKKAPSTKTAEPSLQLPDPEQDGEKFLEEFVNNQAWIPRKGDKIVSLDRDPNMQEDDDEFDEAVEKFENAYNFRYEDPNAATIVSYARNQATLRRSENSSRRRKREDEKQKKEQEKTEKEKTIQKKKSEKVHKLTDVLEQLKKEYGAEINQEIVKKITDTLLNNDFKDDEWDTVLSELFDEEFYQQEGKPSWDDDDDIMADFHADQDKEDEESDAAFEATEVSAKKSRKDKVKEKKLKKKGKRELEEMVEDAVEQNKLKIIEEVEKEQEERKSRARTKEEQDLKFRYREVSPESFGLTTRDIFAADDTQLNQYIGLKKLAPYRSKEQKAKDKRKVTKAKRLREWRKEIFRGEDQLDVQSDEIKIPVDKAKKTSHKKKKHKSST
ncbi:hypothetical protein HG536_0E02400 [Torulaspora globosa]|uniref:Kri1-like C-terminal domain-containing protein n=1 Tax=Torulaspora globosa TaxID=48254 RepID=A0A7G3ZIJ3_9SACH|nr:uncharacterized protein HG536_0E02400 [Torulaspora globosa]QLL33329.1 hypothetical protein HG536_0E02400 [Torulaspora globosa]